MDAVDMLNMHLQGEIDEFGDSADTGIGYSIYQVGEVVNPAKPETLIGFEYKSDGRIDSTNEAVNHDLNDVLKSLFTITLYYKRVLCNI